MTTETGEQAFGHYLAARRAVGRSDEFADELFEAAPTSSASRSPQLIMPAEDVRITVGAGKTYMLLVRTCAGLTQTDFRTLAFAPFSPEVSNAEITVAHRALLQVGSMATQQAVTEEPNVERLISYIRTSITAKHRRRVAARLTELQKCVLDEESDGKGISGKSLQHFLAFLKSYPSLLYPAISVTPDGNIYASWKSGSDRVFSIHFLPQGETRFVLFFPNPKHPTKTVRLSGTATADTTMSVAERHGISNWVME
jgi:hypothetical protein